MPVSCAGKAVSVAVLSTPTITEEASRWEIVELSSATGPSAA